jgi:hypothetical protein
VPAAFEEVGTMKKILLSFLIGLLGTLAFAASAFAYDCSSLPEWKRQAYYLIGAKVQYQEVAYEATENTKRDFPDEGGPWMLLGACEGTNGGGGGVPVDPQPISIYGVWHCGNSFCDWSQERAMTEFDHANHWIIDRGDGNPSVNLVVLSFLQPLKLLDEVTDNAFLDGIPRGMTAQVVGYFQDAGIRVLLSMGGVTYTDAWNEALVTDADRLAQRAVAAIDALGADGLEIDWENGRPNADELTGIEAFIAGYNALTDKVLTLDLAVGNRYLQELSRRAAADWLPNGDIDYVNAMVPRGEPDTDQWQEHVDGKLNYDPPILPKPPAKIAVSLWLTDSRKPNANCVDFKASTQLEKAEYVQTVLPNGSGETHGFLGYMFWAAECPSARNVCTTPPNGCDAGMGVGSVEFTIDTLDFSVLRAW